MTAREETPDPRRWTILAICCLSLLIVGLDNTIVNVALPDMERRLGASLSQLQWIVDAYTLVLASLLMLSGSTADRLGRRRVFQTGLALFGLGSLLCSIAPNPGSLIGFRGLQAVGGSMLNPVALSIIANVFTDRAERARAMGVWAGTVGISMALGPVAGGALVDGFGWRSIFWVNLPVVVTALVLTWLFVPESKAPRARRIDPVGQLLVIAFMATVTYGIIEGPNAGWTSARIVASFAVAAAALVSLLWYEPRRTEPLIELRFFRSLPFSGATVIAVGAFVSLGGFLFMNTLYLQQTRGLSPFEAGLRTLPMAVLTVVIAPLSGRVVASRGPRVPFVLGGVGVAGSALMLTGLTDVTPYAWLLAAYTVFGFGFGWLNAPITNAAVSGMPAAQAGVAAAVASTSRQLGTTLGVAIVGVMAGTATAQGTGGAPTDLAAASHACWWLLVGCGLAIIAVGVAISTPRARRTAERAAALF